MDVLLNIEIDLAIRFLSARWLTFEMLVAFGTLLRFNPKHSALHESPGFDKIQFGHIQLLIQ
jgi:hypothetical protein